MYDSDSSGSNISTSPTRKKSPIRKKKTSRIQKLSQEQLLVALQKKKECNSKAQAIVEKVLDTVTDPDELREMLKDINQCHMDDIVDERAIQKLCGYPICNEKIVEVPNKQYQITMKTNKVYDITERKKFCSNQCYKAAKYIKEQMLTSPLWLRDQVDIPEFKFLSLS